MLNQSMSHCDCNRCQTVPYLYEHELLEPILKELYLEVRDLKDRQEKMDEARPPRLSRDAVIRGLSRKTQTLTEAPHENGFGHPVPQSPLSAGGGGKYQAKNENGDARCRQRAAMEHPVRLF